MRIAITPETPLQDRLRERIAARPADLRTLPPPKPCYDMVPAAMAAAGTILLGVRARGRVVAAVKRMYTSPPCRGPGGRRRCFIFCAKVLPAATAGGL